MTPPSARVIIFPKGEVTFNSPPSTVATSVVQVSPWSSERDKYMGVGSAFAKSCRPST